MAVLAELGGKLRESLRKLGSVGNGANAGSLTSSQLNTLLSDIARALIEADVNVKLVNELRSNIRAKVMDLVQDDDDDNDGEDAAAAATGNPQSEDARKARAKAANLSKIVQRAVVDELVALLTPKQQVKEGDSTTTTTTSKTKKAYQMRKGKPNVILFVGLQGAGKTTTVAKFANYYQRRGWKTAMVCADTFRAGAFDQLKQNATKLRVPFYGSYTLADPVVIAEEGVAQFRKEKYEVIIVDTSGRHKQEASLLTEMQEISAAVQPDNVILVMDATQGQAVYDQASAFSSAVSVGSVIVTKLDGHAKGGGALSAVAATQSPIVFTGTGEHFEDLDAFYPESFISKLLGFGDVRGLMEAMKGVGGDDDKKKQEEMMEKMSKGEFTLRMMYAQFEKVMSMGSFGKLAGMIPGMPDYLLPGAGGAADQESTRRLRKFMIIMDSMNSAELDGKVDLHKKHDANVTSRIRRIAAGSGCHPKEVMMLLQAHKQFEGMISKMGKSGMIGKQAQTRQAQLAAQMSKNPKLIQQRLNQMDPRVIQQMGGRDQVMAMMQQMAKGGGGGAPGAAGGGPGGGMPDLASMMGGMGGGGMPGMGMPGMGMPPGMMMPPGMGMPPDGGAGGMPPGMPPLPPGMTMEGMMKMAQAMGMGGPGGMPPGMGGGPPPGGAGRR